MIFKKEQNEDRYLSMDMTPFIGVMLALIMVLIISVPPRRDLVIFGSPQGCFGFHRDTPKVVYLDIDFDNSLVWEGSVITETELQTRLANLISPKGDVTQVHLRPSFMASTSTVIKVMNSLQLNEASVIGLIVTEDMLK